MASKISVVIDVVTDRANTALGSFRKSIGEADGAVGKFKAGASGAFDQVKQNAGNLALAGGAALVAFGAKAVAEFNNLAIESGRLSEALGMPVEEASRLIEVAGDVGIEMDALEKTIGRMNRSAADTPEAFAAINAQIVKNADGTVNVNKTFLSTVDALNKMPDATQRASAAQKIFGRSWMDIAELVGQGADQITESMAGVSGAQIIDEDEVKKARAYREAMDNLNDVLTQLTLTFGEQLTPIIADAANAIVGLQAGIAKADDSTGGWISTANRWAGEGLKIVSGYKALEMAAEEFADTSDQSGEAFEARMYMMQSASREAEEVFEDTGQAYIDNAKGMQAESQRTADKLTADWDRILGKINEEQAFRDASAEFGELRDAAFTAWTEGGAAVDGYRDKQLEAQAALSSYIMELGDIPPEKATEINALIDQGKIDEAERLLNFLTRRRQMLISPVVTGSYGGGYTAKGGIDGDPSTPFAKGGIVTGPTNALIGEAGREAVIPLDSPRAADMLGGLGGGTNITINMPPGSDGDSVVRAIRQYVRRNGPIQGIT